MLPPNYLEGLESQIANLYLNLEIDIINEISDRIARVGYANTIVHNDVEIAQQAGILYSNIVRAVAKNTNRTYSEIEKIFTDAGIKTIQLDDKIYEKAGLNPIPINMDSSLLQILTGSIEKTSRNLNNLSGTTAITSQTEFINAMNKAYLEVSTGVKSYSQSIVDAIDELAERGTSVVYPTGYKTSLENATRMNIVTSVNQTCGKMQLQRAEELGWDLMELTAFADSRPTHAVWQGKIVSLSGKAGYLSKEDIGYGEVDGFKGINCRHDWSPYYEGSSRTYSDELLNNYRNTKVNYNGQEISLYDATQIQRKYERQIRIDKKKIAGREKLLTSITTDKTEKELKAGLNYHKAKLEIDKNNLNDLLKQTELSKQYERTKISAKGEYRTKKVVNYVEKLYNNSSKIDNLQSFVDDETIRKHIRNNENYQKLKENKQLEHLIDSEKYIKGKSYFKDVSLDELKEYINKYSGTGQIERKSTDNSFNNKEVVIIDELIGVNVNPNTLEETITHKFKIHYSKDGSHIVPKHE